MLVQFIFNWFFEAEIYHSGRKDTPECLAFKLRTEFVGDMLRATIFSIILSLNTRYEKTHRVPSLYISSLTDFSQDAQCRAVFRNYLKKKFPEDLPSYEASLLKIDTGKVAPFSSNAVIPPAIEERFQAYRKTKSFSTLRTIIIEAEEVEACGFKSQ